MTAGFLVNVISVSTSFQGELLVHRFNIMQKAFKFLHAFVRLHLTVWKAGQTVLLSIVQILLKCYSIERNRKYNHGILIRLL